MKIVIADDLEILRCTYRLHCSRMADVEILGEAGDGVTAVECIGRTQPDCVLLDLEMPHLNGFEVIRAVRPVAPRTRFLILSGHCNIRTVQLAEALKVDGYVDKVSCNLGVLEAALREVMAGRRYLSSWYRTFLLELRYSPSSYLHILSEREQEILDQIAESQSNGEISAALGIAERTVATHRANIMQKVGIDNTPKLIKYAREAGFGSMRVRPKPEGA